VGGAAAMMTVCESTRPAAAALACLGVTALAEAGAVVVSWGLQSAL
jgi:hypothetical protein